MITRSSSLHRILIVLVLVLVAVALLNSVIPHAATQTPEDATALSYQAFSQLAEVYQLGSKAPDLVAKLNMALQLIEKARLKRSTGDEAGAVVAEGQARSTIADIMSSIPGAKQSAERGLTTRTLLVAGLVPVAVALSTFAFYVGLRMWRWYGKMRLFEMRIVEKKKIED